jgi:hypothetical protein
MSDQRGKVLCFGPFELSMCEPKTLFSSVATTETLEE